MNNSIETILKQFFGSRPNVKYICDYSDNYPHVFEMLRANKIKSQEYLESNFRAVLMSGPEENEKHYYFDFKAFIDSKNFSKSK